MASLPRFAKTPLAAACLLALVVLSQGKLLTMRDWDSETRGKLVFIKFFDPRCQHCKTMKADFEEVMKEYDGHDVVLVAEVDCTASGRSLCESFSINGFPTIMQGDPKNFVEYKGGRDAGSMRRFVQNNLPRMCTPGTQQFCDERKKSLMQRFMRMPRDQLQTAMERHEANLEKAIKKNEEVVAVYKKKIEDAKQEKQKVQREVEEAGLKTMKQVLAHRTPGGGKPGPGRSMPGPSSPSPGRAGPGKPSPGKPSAGKPDAGKPGARGVEKPPIPSMPGKAPNPGGKFGKRPGGKRFGKPSGPRGGGEL